MFQRKNEPIKIEINEHKRNICGWNAHAITALLTSENIAQRRNEKRTYGYHKPGSVLTHCADTRCYHEARR